MIGYVTIGVNDMEKACAFYDGLFGELGGKQMFGQDRIKFYGTGRGQPMVAICVPYDQQAQHLAMATCSRCPLSETTLIAFIARRLNLAQRMRASPVNDCQCSMAPISATQMATKSAFMK